MIFCQINCLSQLFRHVTKRFEDRVMSNTHKTTTVKKETKYWVKFSSHINVGGERKKEKEGKKVSGI